MDDIAELVELEDEKFDKQIITIICSEAITGFDTVKEMNLVQEMIKTTLEEYNKQNNTKLE